MLKPIIKLTYPIPGFISNWTFLIPLIPLEHYLKLKKINYIFQVKQKLKFLDQNLNLIHTRLVKQANYFLSSQEAVRDPLFRVTRRRWSKRRDNSEKDRSLLPLHRPNRPSSITFRHREEDTQAQVEPGNRLCRQCRLQLELALWLRTFTEGRSNPFMKENHFSEILQRYKENTLKLIFLTKWVLKN